MKKLKGFTLIELIVVIAIIGVLCSILVPGMMSYISKSRITTNNANAKELYSELQGTLISLDREGIIVTGDIIDSELNIEVSKDQDVAESEITEINGRFVGNSKGRWASKVSNGSIECVVYSNAAVTYVGGYPTKCPEEKQYKMASGFDPKDFFGCAVKEPTEDWSEKALG